MNSLLRLKQRTATKAHTQNTRNSKTRTSHGHKHCKRQRSHTSMRVVSMFSLHGTHLRLTHCSQAWPENKRRETEKTRGLKHVSKANTNKTCEKSEKRNFAKIRQNSHTKLKTLPQVRTRCLGELAERSHFHTKIRFRHWKTSGKVGHTTLHPSQQTGVR